MIIHDVEQRSPEWYALRTGIPTASEFSKLVTSKGQPSKSADKYALSLAAEAYSNVPELDAWQGNQFTERGKEIEDAAIKAYEFVNDVTVTRVGFVTADDGSIGCSPDGLVGDDGLIELKCLKAERHIGAILYHRKHKRCQPDYVVQPQGLMMVCERSWCDLVLYHPYLPILTIRQHNDPAFHQALADQLAFVKRRRDEVLTVLRDGADADSLPISVVPVPAASLSEMHETEPVF